MIGVETNRAVYLGDGKTTEFPFTFTALDRGDISVTLVDPDGNRTTMEKDYYVDMDKKAVMYPGYPTGEEPAETERPEILPTGWYLVIQRNTVINQETSLGDKWPFNVSEEALDKLTMIAQDLATDAKRHLILSVEAEGVDTMLPMPTPNSSFFWDETGKKLVTGPNPNIAAGQAADSAAAALASENAARRSEEAAKASEEAAMASQTAAKESEDAAAQSEETAAISEDAAKTSETNAKASENAAAASESAAKASEEAAAQSEANAAGSEESAAASAQAAAKSQELALASANAAALSKQHAATSEENAANSEAAAAESAAKAEQAAGGVGDPVIKVEEQNGKVTVETANGKKNEFWAGLNILQRNKEYKVGDIAYSASLPSYNYLECITAGTTGAEEPDFSEVKTRGG